ncbi:hypothetical protein [Paracoccus versutus]|uniref:Uncharacterized protein n=1 Tax=Paracoccus versutus TaxID=34007 RepID=A0A3D9XGL0_PARVE|nr:hypothetical protein [Paracoccus versutus]REF69657.1 hypothetical protein BDD41_2367 [Paracoccus versutus]WGR57972.1 hypothetical protein E3U25_18705 [Paracoccus versutus]
MSILDKSRLLLFVGGTVPTTGVSAADLSAEMIARRNADNQGDVLALQTDTEASTGQLIMASIPAAQTHISLSAGQMLRFRCPFANTGPDPIISIGGMEFTIRARNGGTLAANDLSEGQRFLGYIFWNAPDRKEVRLSESVRFGDISGLPAALSNTGKTFTSRTAAVNFGQANLPGSLNLITTIEGEYLAVRSFSNAADDPLFETQPSWGVALRLPRRELLDNEVSARSSMIRPVADMSGYILASVDRNGNYVMPGWAQESDGGWPSWIYDEIWTRVEPMLPELPPSGVIREVGGEYIFSQHDANGNFIMPGWAQESDGGWPAWIYDEIWADTSSRMPDLPPSGVIREVQGSGLIFSQHDRDGNYVMPGWAQESDGGWPAWVYDEIWDNLSDRISDPGSASQELDSPFYDRSAEVTFARARSDLTKIAVIGSSTPWEMRTEIAGAFDGLVPAYGGVEVEEVTNDCKSGERSMHTAARLGAIPALITVTGGSVPASGSVLVTTTNMTGNNQLKAYDGWLGNVRGTLAWSAADGSLQFTRTESGSVVAMSPNTPFIPILGPTLRDRFFVIHTGWNDAPGGSTWEHIFERREAIVNYLDARDLRFSIWTDMCDMDWAPENPNRAKFASGNAAMIAKWGPLVWDMNAYFLGAQVWTDAAAIPSDILNGLAPGFAGPTTEDLAQQAAGNRCPSLSRDAGHFNALGRYLAAQEFRRHLINNNLYRTES